MIEVFCLKILFIYLFLLLNLIIFNIVHCNCGMEDGYQTCPTGSLECYMFALMVAIGLHLRTVNVLFMLAETVIAETRLAQ